MKRGSTTAADRVMDVEPEKAARRSRRPTDRRLVKTAAETRSYRFSMNNRNTMGHDGWPHAPLGMNGSNLSEG